MEFEHVDIDIRPIKWLYGQQSNIHLGFSTRKHFRLNYPPTV